MPTAAVICSSTPTAKRPVPRLECACAASQIAPLMHTVRPTNPATHHMVMGSRFRHHNRKVSPIR